MALIVGLFDEDGDVVLADFEGCARVLAQMRVGEPIVYGLGERRLMGESTRGAER